MNSIVKNCYLVFLYSEIILTGRATHIISERIREMALV
jgi:hypothetical protein